MLTFVTVKTYAHSYNRGERGEARNVTLSVYPDEGRVILLGNLEHCTEIVVDQQLVYDLQGVVDLLKSKGEGGGPDDD